MINGDIPLECGTTVLCIHIVLRKHCSKCSENIEDMSQEYSSCHLVLNK